MPVIPPPAEMSPSDVVLLAFAAEEDFSADLSGRAEQFFLLAQTISQNATFPLDIGELTAAGWDIASADALFDAMARLDHPDVQAVLTMIGRHCDDKKTAQAARKAAHKAVSFAASRRRG